MKDEPLVKECERLIALHIWSKIPVGTASLRYGPVMSAADTFDVYIEGKGGHGALPHQTIDPIVAGAEFVNALQTVVSREVNPLEPAVLSVTTFQAGTTSNVIPASAHLSGQPVPSAPHCAEAYPGILRRVARGVGETSRAKIRTEYHFGPPPRSTMQPVWIQDAEPVRRFLARIMSLIGNCRWAARTLPNMIILKPCSF